MFGSGKVKETPEHKKIRRRQEKRGGFFSRRKSLSRSMQRIVLGVAILILMVATFLNWIVSKIQFETMFSLNSMQMVNSMKTVVDLVGDFDEYSAQILETWDELPDDIKKDPSSGEYRSYFDEFENSEYGKTLTEHLKLLKASTTVGDLYLAAVNRETGDIIYLLDPPGDISESHFEAGMYEKLTADELRQLIPEEGDYGSYTEKTPEFGKIIVYGVPVVDNVKEPYRILAMYDYPVVFSSLTAVITVVIYFLVLSVVIILIVLLTRRHMKKRLVRPINSIATAAEEYKELKKSGHEGVTSCFSNLDIRTRDELQDLSDVLSEMETDIGVYEQNLTRAAAEREHIQTELSVATGIQTHMLPDSRTAFPGRKEFSIFASMNPAKEVGGDFYDFFLIDEDHLGIVIADVSGKGIPAALFMMSSMIVINNFASLGFSPKEVLERANTKICSANVLNMFVTVWFGILDLNTGEITAANAGHEYPAVCTAENGFELMKDKHGLVIGGMEGIKYTEYTFKLEKEGTLFVYTDGVPEATDAEDELYGTDRMISALNAVRDKNVDEICPAIQEDIDRFVKDAPQFDDITMVCIRYHGKVAD